MLKAPHVADAECGFVVRNITPDFCDIEGQIVPYEIARELPFEKAGYASDVVARGAKVLKRGSVVQGVEGDAGAGVHSTVSLDDGDNVIVTGAPNVLVEGQSLVRDGDLALLNALFTSPEPGVPLYDATTGEPVEPSEGATEVRANCLGEVSTMSVAGADGMTPRERLYALLDESDRRNAALDDHAATSRTHRDAMTELRRARLELDGARRRLGTMIETNNTLLLRQEILQDTVGLATDLASFTPVGRFVWVAVRAGARVVDAVNDGVRPGHRDYSVDELHPLAEESLGDVVSDPRVSRGLDAKGLAEAVHELGVMHGQFDPSLAQASVEDLVELRDWLEGYEVGAMAKYEAHELQEAIDRIVAAEERVDQAESAANEAEVDLHHARRGVEAAVSCKDEA